MTELEFVEKHLGEYKVRRNEINVKVCPFCNSHKDKYKFFINTDKHTYICHRGSCGARGTFNQLAKLYGEKADYMADIQKKYFENTINKKEYIKPKQKLLDISVQAQNYIQTRKISLETAMKFKIKSDSKGNIVFPYFDEKSEHVLNKIRIPRKFIKGKDATKIWQEGGGKSVLFGMDMIDISKPVLITEGEWDCLAVYEAGYKNVVSIPFGTENMEWITECWEWLEQVKEFIIWFDNDKPGKASAKRVISKLGSYRCKYVQQELKKDCNEILAVFGKEKVIEIINSAEYVVIENLQRVSECVEQVTERILYGFQDLDYELGGCRMGELTIWTGKRGGGKSTILSQTIPYTVEQDYKVFIYSGELTNAKVKDWLDRQIAGEKYIITEQDQLTRREEYKVKRTTARHIAEWYKDYIFCYGDSGANEESILFEIMEYAYKRHNIKRFILDNLKVIKYQDENNLYRSQGLFVSRCKSFCRKYDVHIDLVVHPRKTDKSSDLYDEDIGGSVDIIDLADNIISISRLTPEYYERHKKREESQMRHKDHDRGDFDKYTRNVVINVLKNREYGDVGKSMYYFYDSKSKRIYKNFNSKIFKPLVNYVEKEDDICPF